VGRGLHGYLDWDGKIGNQKKMTRVEGWEKRQTDFRIVALDWKEERALQGGRRGLANHLGRVSSVKD